LANEGPFGSVGLKSWGARGGGPSEAGQGPEGQLLPQDPEGSLPSPTGEDTVLLPEAALSCCDASQKAADSSCKSVYRLDFAFMMLGGRLAGERFY